MPGVILVLSATLEDMHKLQQKFLIQCSFLDWLEKSLVLTSSILRNLPRATVFYVTFIGQQFWGFSVKANKQNNQSHQCPQYFSSTCCCFMRVRILPHLVFHGSLDVHHEVLPFLQQEEAFLLDVLHGTIEQ